MAWLRRKRGQVMMPRSRRARQAEPGKEVKRRRFAHFVLADLTKFFVDFTTMVASIATVVTLVFYLDDRRESANNAAWTVLHSYLQQDRGAPADAQQLSALEKLVSNGVDFRGTDMRKINIIGGRLQGLRGDAANFRGARFEFSDLSKSVFLITDLEDARLENCLCDDVLFEAADLEGASLSGAFRGANFDIADISDLHFQLDAAPRGSQSIARDIFRHACFRPGHPPVLSGPFEQPGDPQGRECMKGWGQRWADIGER